MKLYVASSLRNRHYRSVISKIRNQGHEAYDFGDPPAGSEEFGILPPVRPDQHYESLRGHIGQATFKRDAAALRVCDACVLVLPCGKSGHIEAGFAAGMAKPLAIYLEPHAEQEPEVMYNFGTLVWNDQMFYDWLTKVAREQTGVKRPIHNQQMHENIGFWLRKGYGPVYYNDLDFK